MNSTFKWESFDHFYNTVRKRTREKIGHNVEPRELKEICYSLFKLSEEIDTDNYINPTGFLIAEIKRARDLAHYAIVIRKYQRILSEDRIEGFKETLLISDKKARNQDEDEVELVPINELSPPIEGSFKPLRSFDGLIPESPGVYFLFNSSKELLYIGKSICLSNRVPSSFFGKKATYAKIMLTETKADAHILEPYCISIYAPPLNGEFNTGDMPTFHLELPPLSDFIEPKVIGEYEIDY